MSRRRLIGANLVAIGLLILLAVGATASVPMSEQVCDQPGPVPWEPRQLLGATSNNPDPTTRVSPESDLETRYDPVQDVSSIVVDCHTSPQETCCVAWIRVHVEGDQRHLGWTDDFLIRSTSPDYDVLVPDPEWDTLGNASSNESARSGLMTTNTYEIISPRPYIATMSLGFGVLAAGTAATWTRRWEAGAAALAAGSAGVVVAATKPMLLGYILIWYAGLFWMPGLALLGFILAASTKSVWRRVSAFCAATFLAVTPMAFLWMAFKFGFW